MKNNSILKIKLKRIVAQLIYFVGIFLFLNLFGQEMCQRLQKKNIIAWFTNDACDTMDRKMIACTTCVIKCVSAP